MRANEGQGRGEVREVFTAEAYPIDGEYMFGFTVTPIAKLLEGLKEATELDNFRPRFSRWGKNFASENPSGCARGEDFRRLKRRKKQPPGNEVQSDAGDEDPPQGAKRDKKDKTGDMPLRAMYLSLCTSDPRAHVLAEPPNPKPYTLKSKPETRNPKP